VKAETNKLTSQEDGNEPSVQVEEGPRGAMQRAGGEGCPVEGGGGLHLRRRDDATWRPGGVWGEGLGAVVEAERPGEA